MAPLMAAAGTGGVCPGRLPHPRWHPPRSRGTPRSKAHPSRQRDGQTAQNPPLDGQRIERRPPASVHNGGYACVPVSGLDHAQWSFAEAAWRDRLGLAYV